MRLLFYNHAPEISGAERSLLALAAHARAAGHDVALCAPRGPLADATTYEGIAFVPVAPLVLGRSRDPLVLARYLVGTAQPLVDLARTVRRAHPDVVHANSIRSGLIAAMALRLARPRPQLVVHARDALHDGALDRLTAVALGREADVVVAISRYVARSMGAKGTARVLHNAIDLERYRRDEAGGQALRCQLGIPDAAPLLVVAAQLTPWKGQLDALDAFALLRATHPDAHLVLAGDAKFTGKHRRYDTLAYRDALRARAAHPDLRGHAHVVGDIADVVALYSAATLLVVPSWAEPFGRVVVEAMAAGCPVLATDAGGVPEIVTHGVDGWLVPPRDPAALAAALRCLLDAPALRATLARNGRVTVQGRFSLTGYMAAMEGIWRDALRNDSIGYTLVSPTLRIGVEGTRGAAEREPLTEMNVLIDRGR